MKPSRVPQSSSVPPGHDEELSLSAALHREFRSLHLLACFMIVELCRSKDNTVTLSQEARMSRPLNYSTLKKVSRERIVPELREEDLEEKFVKGKPLSRLKNFFLTFHAQAGVRAGSASTSETQT